MGIPVAYATLAAVVAMVSLLEGPASTCVISLAYTTTTVKAVQRILQATSRTRKELVADIRCKAWLSSEAWDLKGNISSRATAMGTSQAVIATRGTIA